MAQLILTLADTNDDGYEEVATGFTDGVWSAFAEFIGSNTPPDTEYHSGWRWVNVTIAQGSTITSAILRLRARNAITGTIGNVHGEWRGHKVANCPVWQQSVLVPTTITPTTAAVQYDPAVWVVDDYYDFDLTTIVQELVNQGAFASGNAIGIALRNDGSTGANNVRFYEYNDGDTTNGRLTIDYTAGGPAPLEVRLAEAQIGGSLF
jgi:hypothetical protein